jgi:hypothetical protein
MGSGGFGRRFLKELDGISNLRNYIDNALAARNTLGWVTYADAAGAAPVDGVGGSPNITFTRSTSAPLAGLASFVITKDAANRQGQGASFPFIIANCDRGKILTIKGEYAIDSGTYSGGTQTTDSDITAYIIDETNGVVIQPVAFKLDGAVIGQNYSLRASFQSASNSNNYRLAFHVATTSALAYALKVDVISVSSQLTGIAPINTDEQAYTPTIVGLGTVANVEFNWHRKGTRIVVNGKLTTGTPTAVEARIGLPPGIFTASSTVIPSIRNFGIFARKASTTDAFKGGLVIATAGTNYVNITSNGVFNSTTANPFAAALGSDSGTADTISFAFEVPVAGWGDGRVVSMSVNANTGTLGTSFADITTWDDNLRDSHGTFNTSTGVYTIPYAGKYKVHARVYGSTSGTTNWAGLQIMKNGVAVSEFYDTAGGASNAAPSVHAEIDCVAGDLIKVQGIAAASTAINTTAIRNTFTVSRMQGPSQIGAAELIAAQATTSTTAVSSATPATFTVELKDTHTSFDGTTFTAPARGTYSIKAATYSTSAHDIQIFKNGSLLYQGGHGTSVGVSTIAVDVDLAAGDTIQIRDGTAVTLSSGATINYLMIRRVGV